MKYGNKEYITPQTDIFQLSSKDRLMQDLQGTGTHPQPEGGEGF